jgi:hypothetical protein
MQDCYSCLTKKVLGFFLAVHNEFTADWVVKVDDDVYMSPQRLPLAVQQWDQMGAGYVGCFQHGDVFSEARDKKSEKWFEPAWPLLGKHYALYAFGSIYAVSGAVINDVIAMNAPLLRHLANEGAL